MLVKIYTDGAARGNPDGPGGLSAQFGLCSCQTTGSEPMVQITVSGRNRSVFQGEYRNQ